MRDEEVLNKTVEYLIRQERSMTPTGIVGEMAKDGPKIQEFEGMIHSFYDFLRRKYILQSDFTQPLGSFCKITARNKTRLEDKGDKFIAEFLVQYYGDSD